MCRGTHSYRWAFKGLNELETQVLVFLSVISKATIIVPFSVYRNTSVVCDTETRYRVDVGYLTTDCSKTDTVK